MDSIELGRLIRCHLSVRQAGGLRPTLQPVGKGPHAYENDSPGHRPEALRKRRRGAGRYSAHRSNELYFHAGDRLLIPCSVSDLSDYVDFRLYPGAQMGMLHRENAAGHSRCDARGRHDFGHRGHGITRIKRKYTEVIQEKPVLIREIRVIRVLS